MSERKPLTISVDMNTDKLQLKLRAIAKHAEALAGELAAIDNGWQCDCGSVGYDDTTLYSDSDQGITIRTCLKCKERYAIHDDDLPTRFEGSD